MPLGLHVYLHVWVYVNMGLYFREGGRVIDAGTGRPHVLNSSYDLHIKVTKPSHFHLYAGSEFIDFHAAFITGNCADFFGCASV